MFTQDLKDSDIEVKTQAITTFSSGQFSVQDERTEDMESSDIRTYLRIGDRSFELIYSELKQLANLLDAYLHIHR